MTETERRVLGERVSAKGDVLVGYAAVYNSPAVIAGLFREQIAPGAFHDAIVRDDVVALFNHSPNYPLGRTSARTLRLSSDSHGLRYEVDLIDAEWTRALAASIARGDVKGSSFAFEVQAEVWDHSGRGLPMRTLTKLSLIDVSPVTFPAYASTSVSARARAQAGERPAARPATKGKDFMPSGLHESVFESQWKLESIENAWRTRHLRRPAEPLRNLDQHLRLWAAERAIASERKSF